MNADQTTTSAFHKVVQWQVK